MSNIKVFSDARKFAAGSEWSANIEDIKANFPALIEYWTVEDLTIGTAANKTVETHLLSRTSRLGFSAVSSPSDPNSNGFTLNLFGFSSGIIPSGVALLPAPTKGNLLFLSVGRFGAANNKLQLGDQASVTGVNIRGNTTVIRRTATDSSSIPALTPANFPGGAYPLDGGIGIVVDNVANTAYKIGVSDDGTYTEQTANGTNTGNPAGTWTGILESELQPMPVDTSGSRVVMIWDFTTLPSAAEITVALQWMAVNNRPYPAWAGRS